VTVLARADPRYPPRLLDLARPPDPLWYEGDATLLSRECIAIVGTRRMTPYGERIARELAIACAESGVVVVSGLAQGIDSAAHAAAFDARGETIAVVGEGLASFDPHGRRRRLAARIRERGCLVSEYPPLAPAQGWMFARRNATIAALARAIVVVEAPHGSGALITARRSTLRYQAAERGGERRRVPLPSRTSRGRCKVSGARRPLRVDPPTKGYPPLGTLPNPRARWRAVP